MAVRLLIISDTPVEISRDGQNKVFEPTLREVEYLSSLFEKIEWYGMPVAKTSYGALRQPNSVNISIHSLVRVVGGDRFWEKLGILPKLPFLAWQILVLCRTHEYIHTRGPSLPALIAIFLSKILRRKKFWHKYAGNWNELNPPMAYKIQRALLKSSLHPVTVNGYWGDSNANILSFENPCFSETELREARSYSKVFVEDKFVIAFVGRLEREKGVHLVVEAARRLPVSVKWYIVGDGKERDWVIEHTTGMPNVQVTGTLSRTELNKVYRESHIFVLPTVASEGFPKVVTEACGFGCVPVVSGTSSLIQYVKPEFGYILDQCDLKTVIRVLGQAIDNTKLEEKARGARRFAEQFTYERFVRRIKAEVFKLD